MKARQLVILSGKGGTGKTSISASLAGLARRAVLADCDVDAPDLHLILRPGVISRERFVSGYVASIDGGVCTRCGRCIQECAFSAIDEGYSVDSVACEGCGVCELVCPVGAAKLSKSECGEWFVSGTRFGTMVHARLDPGRENSGRLVSLVRSKAIEIAERESSGIIVIDGPPGIGCPVIASVSGCDMALVVTEPSMSGESDLLRALDMVSHFGAAAAVIINKWDINAKIADRIEATCGDRGVPVVGRIPYDTAFTQAQIAGLSLLEYGEGAAVDGTRDACTRALELIES